MTKTELMEQLKLTDEEIEGIITDIVKADITANIHKAVAQAQLDKVFKHPDLYLYEPLNGDSFIFRNLHEISEMED